MRLVLPVNKNEIDGNSSQNDCNTDSYNEINCLLNSCGFLIITNQMIMKLSVFLSGILQLPVSTGLATIGTMVIKIVAIV